MTLGDGILWSTVLALLAAGIYALSVRKKWKVFGKVLAVLILIGCLIGGGFWGYLEWQDRPYVVDEFESIRLGMRPVDVTILKGKPQDDTNHAEKSEKGDYYTLSYMFDVDPDADGFLYVAFRGSTAEELAVRRVCRKGGYGDLLGFGEYSRETDIVDKLGKPTSVSIRDTGLAKFINYGQWNVAYQIQEGRARVLCMTTAPITFIDEYGAESEPDKQRED